MSDLLCMTKFVFSQTLLGWVLTPVAFLIGVPWEDCPLVAELIGIKTILNEFVAFADLSVYIENRKNGTAPFISVSGQCLSPTKQAHVKFHSTLGVKI